ncbi:MAG: ABC transporter, partial [Okeania sp. SIO2H7]|nr:ABC transporter [Okeania sp. SIO2H7]
MKIIKNTWTYIFFLGPFLIIMGLSAGFVSATWEPIPLALIISGIVIVGLWLLYLSYSTEKKSDKLGIGRATEAGTNALVATLSFLIIIGLINFLAVRYEYRLDLTEAQIFTLSPQTQEILTNLEKPVKVWLFEAGENPLNKQLLENYQREGGGNFSYEFVNPYNRPGLALEYGVKQLGEIHLEVGDKKDVIVSQQLQVLTEENLTNNIQKLLSETPAKVYFLQGHGERTIEEGDRGLAEAVTALEERNFIVETLNLAETTGVPNDADAILVFGPEREFLEAEVEALQEYLERGGGLLLAIDYQTDPGLDNLLEEWGVLLDTRLAIDDPQIGRLVGLDPWVALVTSYGNHPITENFADGVSLYPFARAVESEATPGITESPIIWTNERSWAEADVRGQLEFNGDRDRSGPLSLGV